ncbi:MAG: GNAT family N-acetyltransferase [Opitutales bacterium]|nr:GNAT family N-acetyltransferase [Opitutales bacterium]
MDDSIDSELMEEKIQQQEILLAKEEKEIIALLRFSLFWDNTPFINLLLVKEEKRKEGIGTNLIQKWESEMKEKGFERVMTSSQSDETGQEFFKKLKYKEIGSFEFPEQEPELLFLKEFNSNKAGIETRPTLRSSP